MSSTAAPKSIVHGPSHPPLKLCTIGQLLRQQADRVNSRRAVVEVQSGARLTYHDLEIRAKQIARALIASGVQRGDRIAIFLGNCEVYVEIFFAVARIGAVAVLLHGTYTPNEARNVLRTTGAYNDKCHSGKDILKACRRMLYPVHLEWSGK